MSSFAHFYPHIADPSSIPAPAIEANSILRLGSGEPEIKVPDTNANDETVSTSIDTITEKEIGFVGHVADVTLTADTITSTQA